MAKIVARDIEWNILDRLYHSGDPEFLAVYGRRRVGKTMLITTFCEEQSGIFFNALLACNPTSSMDLIIFPIPSEIFVNSSLTSLTLFPKFEIFWIFL